MTAEIISIGDELLIGQTVNTNASWIGMECSLRGIRNNFVTVISDDEQAIRDAVGVAVKRSDIVFITGGLGPTKDDITKFTLADYFQTKLKCHEPTLKRIEAFFSSRNRPMLEANIRQADLPVDAVILDNIYGTAAGMWFEKEGCIVISMPGVPYEMKGIMLNEVFPRLVQKGNLVSLYHYTLMTQGIGESFLADKISNWEERVRNAGLGLAYLPSPGMVKLRLTSYEGAQRKNEIEKFFKELQDSFPRYVYGIQDESLSEVVGKLLMKNGSTLGSVESCTGGALAHSLISVPGSSEYFQGSLITYSNQLKVQLAGVVQDHISEYTAVSKVVVEEMAIYGRIKLGVDYCISTSGIAGPDGGTDEIPVGSVWVAVSDKNGVESHCFRFGDNRERNIQMTVLTALNMLRCRILGISFEKK
ncbi:MAG: CinA family nicotinamide mononucleotide deamidase-related protein [Cryomorphaceae bacterium]|jgi:nicotinamide-nucleotide amidase|nr:CinA family nicotinamide mononucleotide deamidase-related protein [Cryomorphaceae bacterium]